MSDTGVDAEGEQFVEQTGGESPADTRDGRSFPLHSVVVSDEDAPDRCTVYPRRKSCRDRTTSWLSADFDAFVDLSDAR